MREPLIVQAGPSPLAKVFESFNQQLNSGPTPEQRAYYQAQAQKATIEADQLATQQAAMKNMGGTIAQLFAPQEYSPEPAVGEMGPVAPVPESPEQRAARTATGMAELFANVGKDNAAAIQSGLQTGEAYGSADNMRRSMVLGGKNIDENFSPTGEVANEVALRNTNLDIMKRNAEPRSKTEIEGDLLAKNWDTLDKLNPYQQKGLGVLPSKGMSIVTNPDGTTSFEMGGDDGAMGLTKPNTGVQQKNLQANTELKNYVRKIKGMVGANPSAIGATGNIQRGAQTAYDVATTAAQMFGTPENYAKEIERVQLDALRNGVSLQFDPDLHNVVNINNLLLYKAAEALAGQSGRSVTDNDIKKVKGVTGDPAGWFQSPQSYLTGLDLLEKLADENIATASEILKQGSVAPLAPGAPAAPAQPPAGDANAMMEKARAAIAKGADPGKVMQRLEQMGIKVPLDF